MYKKINVRIIAIIGLLTALQVVLSRFLSIVNIPTMKIGFGFLPILLAALILGPLYAGIVGALSDIIGALLFPIGTYFPGFTVTAFITGMVLGLLLQNKKKSKVQMILFALLAVIIHQCVLSLLVDTIWISILYGASYIGYVISRIPEALIHAAVEFLIIILLGDRIRQLRRFLINE